MRSEAGSGAGVAAGVARSVNGESSESGTSIENETNTVELGTSEPRKKASVLSRWLKDENPIEDVGEGSLPGVSESRRVETGWNTPQSSVEPCGNWNPVHVRTTILWTTTVF